MNRKIVFIGGSISCVILINILNLFQQSNIPNKIDTFLLNVEALAAGEEDSDSNTKEENTWQDGPYTDKEGNIYYWLYTEVNCYGRGVVVCSPGLSSERKEL